MSFSCLYDHSTALLWVFGNNRNITVETYMQFCSSWISATPLPVPPQELSGRTSTRVVSVHSDPLQKVKHCQNNPASPSQRLSYLLQLPMFYVRMWNEDSLSFKTKQAEKELVGQIYSTYNYIMLFQSQISSICECGLSVTWSMSNFWFADSLSPPNALSFQLLSKPTSGGWYLY